MSHNGPVHPLPHKSSPQSHLDDPPRSDRAWWKSWRLFLAARGVLLLIVALSIVAWYVRPPFDWQNPAATVLPRLREALHLAWWLIVLDVLTALFGWQAWRKWRRERNA